MKKRHKYSTMQDLRISKAKLRYESLLYEEKLKNSTGRMFSGVSRSLGNLSFNIRNKLFTFSFIRSLSKSGMFYEFMRNFARGFRQSG